jgi:hypothetical protein
MAKKRKSEGAGAASDRHLHRMVGLRLPASVREAAERVARRERRSLAQLCGILVEEALQARGEWQPPEEGRDA